MAGDAAYQGLRDQIEGLLTEARLHRRQSVEAGKVETYWYIGDALISHFHTRPGAAYGEQVIRNLSKDLGLGLTTLYEIVRFRRSVTTLYARTKLTWSHFRALVHLPDSAQIRRFQALAEEHGWTTRQLKQAIEAEHAGLPVPSTPPGSERPLRARFGQLLTYRVVADPLLPEPSPALDFGFHQIWVPSDLPGFGRVRPGHVVTLETARSGRTRARLRTDRPRLWTYVARILRVVDGDTFTAVADLGLGHRAFSRLRLRGLDTPELYTRRGRTARTFVEQVLSQVEFVVITTWRTDTYGRYLTDLKYLPGQPDPQRVLARGTYLNRQLLREGLAVRYPD